MVPKWELLDILLLEKWSLLYVPYASGLKKHNYRIILRQKRRCRDSASA